MTNTFFVTGTDTDVGKTAVTCALLQLAKQHKTKALGLKPVAAGCFQHDGQWRNQDALYLHQYSSIKLQYQEVNPIALQAPIAPHIAAQQENIPLNVALTSSYCRSVINQYRPDICFIEGAGGWLVPLNNYETFEDFVVAMEIPVILVVGIKLGCINHALLTVRAIQQRGLTLKAWVANRIDPNALVVEENIAALRQRIDAPCLGVVPFLDNPLDGKSLAEYLDLEILLN